MAIRTVQIIRYITPLREGGSLPALIEADDEFMYVMKFKGAGQGIKALIADLIGGEIARVTGLKVPEIVFGTLLEGFGRTEPDEEIQDLMKWSEGLNLGLHFLKGSITFDPLANSVDAYEASKIVWLDAFLMNIDRTPKNANMLSWNKELWLIDHGASLYFHHRPEDWKAQAGKPFVQIKDHVLLKYASQLETVHEEMLTLLTPALIEEVVNLIPDVWLNSTSEINRELYNNFLRHRLSNAQQFLNEARNAREALI